MKQLLFLALLFLANFVVNIEPVLATIVCRGTSITERKVKFILSSVEGKTITIDYTAYSDGELVTKLNGTATRVGMGHNIDTQKVIQRAYELPSKDNSYSIEFAVFSDGTKASSYSEKDGGYLKAVCKPKLSDSDSNNID